MEQQASTEIATIEKPSKTASNLRRSTRLTNPLRSFSPGEEGARRQPVTRELSSKQSSSDQPSSKRPIDEQPDNVNHRGKQTGRDQTDDNNSNNLQSQDRLPGGTDLSKNVGSDIKPKRGRGRPRKYPSRYTNKKQNDNASTEKQLENKNLSEGQNSFGEAQSKTIFDKQAGVTEEANMDSTEPLREGDSAKVVNLRGRADSADVEFVSETGSSRANFHSNLSETDQTSTQEGKSTSGPSSQSKHGVTRAGQVAIVDQTQSATKKPRRELCIENNCDQNIEMLSKFNDTGVSEISAKNSIIDRSKGKGSVNSSDAKKVVSKSSSSPHSSHYQDDFAAALHETRSPHEMKFGSQSMGTSSKIPKTIASARYARNGNHRNKDDDNHEDSSSELTSDDELQNHLEGVDTTGFITPALEQVIADVIIAFADAGLPLTKMEMRRLAKDMLDSLYDPTNSFSTPDGWFEGLRMRHPGISERKLGQRTKQRFSISKSEIRYNWFRLLESKFAEVHDLNAKLIKQYSLKCTSAELAPGNIYNLEESCYTHLRFPGYSNIPKTKEETIEKVSKVWPLVTMFAAIAADGSCVDPSFVVKALRSLPASESLSQFGNCSKYANAAIFQSESGWTDSNVFREWVRHFAQHLSMKNGTLDSGRLWTLLILDDHPSHQDHLAFSMLRDERVCVVFAPDGNSVMPLPLTRVLYGPVFKQYLKKLQYLSDTRSDAREIKDIISMASEAFFAGATPENIKSGFISCGVWPLEKNIADSNEGELDAHHHLSSYSEQSSFWEAMEIAVDVGSSVRNENSTIVTLEEVELSKKEFHVLASLSNKEDAWLCDKLVLSLSRHVCKGSEVFVVDPQITALLGKPQFQVECITRAAIHSNNIDAKGPVLDRVHGGRLFAHKFIAFPAIVHSSHWVLCVAQFTFGNSCQLWYFDSLGNEIVEEVTNACKTYLEVKALELGHEKIIPCIVRAPCTKVLERPVQTIHAQCGVHVIHALHALSKNLLTWRSQIQNQVPNDVSIFRGFLVSQLVRLFASNSHFSI